VIPSIRTSAARRGSRFSQLCAASAFAALIAGVVTATPSSLQAPTPAIEDSGVTILVYHRFGLAVKDAMTVRTDTFRWQLDYLRQHHHPIIPLHTLVSYLRGQAPAPPPRSVVISADDGHESVFTDMLPVVREYRVPVTLFIYPSAISNASYAMTWAQLDALHRTGLFDIQSHTYWHPNFKTEKRRLSPTAYRTFATMQFVKPRTVLRDTLGVEVDLVAWPFGIYDDELIGLAAEAGYLAGFTLDRRLVTARDPIMALPRFLVTDRASGRNFAAMLPREKR
jgi:Polysaccharide deacetylase